MEHAKLSHIVEAGVEATGPRAGWRGAGSIWLDCLGQQRLPRSHLRLPWRSGQAAPQGGGSEVPGYAVPRVQKRPEEAQVPRRHA